MGALSETRRHADDFLSPPSGDPRPDAPSARGRVRRSAAAVSTLKPRARTWCSPCARSDPSGEWGRWMIFGGSTALANSPTPRAARRRLRFVLRRK